MADAPRRINAIETHYNGYRFRSRLEARWATFLDALEIPYEYEPEGFQDGQTWYLPDFWLPQQQCWIEVKPTEPEDYKKQCMLADGTGFPVYTLIGTPEVPPVTVNWDGFLQFCVNGPEHHHVNVPGEDRNCWGFPTQPCTQDADCQCGGSGKLFLPDYQSQWWTICLFCGCVGLTHEGRISLLPCDCVPAPNSGLRAPRRKANPYCPMDDGFDLSYRFHDTRLTAAYEAARSARFERRG